MIKPSIHLNGTSAQSLAEQYSHAVTAVDKAIRCIEENGPNGRDYYPQGNDAMGIASREHAARCAKLTEVRDELRELMHHCLDEQYKRSARTGKRTPGAVDVDPDDPTLTPDERAAAQRAPLRPSPIR